MDISIYTILVQAPALHDLSGHIMESGTRDTAVIMKILQDDNLAPMIILYAPLNQAKNTFECWQNTYQAIVVHELDHRVLCDKPFDTLDDFNDYNESWSKKARLAIETILKGFHPISNNILIVPGSKQAARLLTQGLLRPNDKMHHRIHTRKLYNSEAYLIRSGYFDKVVCLPQRLTY